AAALRIGDLVIGAAEVVAVGRAIVPMNFPGLQIQRTNDVGDAVCVKHALGRDVRYGSAGEIHDPTHLPTLDGPSDHTAGAAPQQPVGSNRQFECAVGPEIMTAVAGLDAVIR